MSRGLTRRASSAAPWSVAANCRQPRAGRTTGGGLNHGPAGGSGGSPRVFSSAGVVSDGPETRGTQRFAPRGHGPRRLRVHGQAASAGGGDEVADLAGAHGVAPERQLGRVRVDEHDVHAARQGVKKGLDEHPPQDRLVGVRVEDVDALEHEYVGHRVHELRLDVLEHSPSPVERCVADLDEKLAADRRCSASMIGAGIVDADEVHLGRGAYGVVVADQLGGVLVERSMAAMLRDPEEGALEVETRAVAVEVDDVHGRC